MTSEQKTISGATRKSNRSAFTLIELLVIIGIIASMVTVSVMSVRQGQGAARQRGAARDVFAVIRHARSVALVSQDPSIITYSTVRSEEGNVVSKIDVVMSKKLSSEGAQSAMTLSGERVFFGDQDSAGDESAAWQLQGEQDAESRPSSSGDGKDIAEILFSTVSEEVFTDIRFHVEKADDPVQEEDSRGMRRSNISAFSNVDYLLGRYEESKKAAEEKKPPEDETPETEDGDGPGREPLPEPVQIVWQVNGMCDAHRVWVHLDGSPKESGLVVDVDMFGAVKVLTPEELEEL